MNKSVTLNPGESKVVTFTFTPSTAKTYLVSADGLSGIFVIVPVPIAEFQVSDLVIKYPELYIGEQQSISVIVTNVGDVSGSYEVVCEVT